ncbi:hypothetical protein KS4_11280 [Poriferisphaera corsica]|uniref:Uncharacterized protein n=1 Tax=Poriferisphaera corsica TaxID=2528020 RepID=A0A517YSA0_9BACT|nr:hypothetical protein [Poriferisphaera corsica]QDU33086.1 hypothetical protein KS4_11280 [Poriferisphaera corsica]
MSEFFGYLYKDSPAALFWLLIAFLPAVWVAGVLFWSGFKGKTRKAKVVCRGCGENLNGKLPEETEVCLGCGVELRKRGTLKLVSGVRWRLVVMGVVVLILPLISGVWTGWKIYGQERKNSYNLRLIDDELLYRRAQVEIVKNRHDSRLWREAAERVRDERFGEEDIKQWNELVDEWLEGTTQDSYVGYDVISDYVAVVSERGDLEDEQLARLIEGIMGRPRMEQKEMVVRENVAWPMVVSFRMRQNYVSMDDLPVFWYLKDVTLDGEPIEAKEVYMNRSSHGQVNFERALFKEDRQVLRFTLVGKCVRPEMGDGFGYELPNEEDLLGVYHEMIVPMEVEMVKKGVE